MMILSLKLHSDCKRRPAAHLLQVISLAFHTEFDSMQGVLHVARSGYAAHC